MNEEKILKKPSEFVVLRGGTLEMSGFIEATTRSEFYEDVESYWSGSPNDLDNAMGECQPLAWAVQYIYFDVRNELLYSLDEAEAEENPNLHRIRNLRERIATLPAEPEDGAGYWLLGLSSEDFQVQVVPEIEKWFQSPPDWRFEDDYLEETGTAQGAALSFFRDIYPDWADILEIDIIEGDRPGSTYYAAELPGDIEETNELAESEGIPVRFKKEEC